VPTFSTFASDTYAIDPSLTRLGLAAAVGAVVVVLARRLRPHLDRILLPEQIAQEELAARLADDLRDCDTSSELLGRMLAHCGKSMALTDRALYIAASSRYELREAHGPG
jgi:hypothetical protein